MTIELDGGAEKREHLDITLSAGVIVTTWIDELILAQDISTRCWGIIAGGCKRLGERIETPLETVYREYEEEIGCPLKAATSGEPFFVGNIILSEGNRTRIGFIYELEIPPFPPNHNFAPKDPKIAQVSPFTMREVIAMLQEESSIYKPDFNRETLLYWVQRQLLQGEFSDLGRKELMERSKRSLEILGLAKNPKIIGVPPLFPEKS